MPSTQYEKGRPIPKDEAALPAAHFDRGDGWCGYCGCVYECPGSVVRTPVEPVNLTRSGFMLRR